MAVRQHLKMVVLAIAHILLICTVLQECSALTYEELIHELNPVIPLDVRQDGNVTVTRGSSDGMVTVIFSGLPNHGTMMVNPNGVEVQNFQVDFPEDPEAQNEETCLTGGSIGWTVHGVALYNPLTAEGNNAVEGDDAELFDSCQGHPDMFGTYHYHQLADACAFAEFGAADVYGIARDGFPIYGPLKEDGSMVQETDLDKCHGRCGVDGKYRYHMTKTFPYIIGCYRGTPVDYSSDNAMMPGGGGMGPPPNGGMGPPPGGDGMMGPPPDGMAKRQAGSPNQCTYNEATGPNYEFQTCPGTPTGDMGGEARHNEAPFILLGLACMITYIVNGILNN